MLYSCGFNVAALSTGTITIATSGKTSIVIDLASLTGNRPDVGTSTWFWHYSNTNNIKLTSQDNQAALRRPDFSNVSFSRSLQTRMQQTASVNSWTSPSGLTCSFSTTTGLYTFAYATQAITITWSSSVGRTLCGFAANTGSATTQVGTVVPTYVINPVLPAVSDPTTNFEPTGIANNVRADDGSGYGLARTTAPLRRDWVQQFETKEHTLRLSATSTHPYSYQQAFEDCRTTTPFLVINGGFGSTTHAGFTFTSEGSTFKPDRASPGNDSQFHITFNTWVEGTLTEY